MSTQTIVAASAAPSVSQSREDATNALLQKAATYNTKPLWAQMTRLNPPLPNPKCRPHVWEYEKIRPELLKAGKLVTEKQAERRVLMLVNPNRDAPYTTDTLYGGLQLVMPNETAAAHRHTAFACRFIIEGNGGFTAVHGKRIKMNRGDVILTPTWNWHDHGKDGSGPMIWLDGLDLPNFMHFPVHFVEHYQDPRYPAEDADSSASPIVFPWAQMKESLDKLEGPSAALPYLKKNGTDISKTLGTSALRINAGTTSPEVHNTSSSMFHVIEGSGHTVIEGTEYRWTKGDTFCVPTWHRHQHHANDGETVYLYRCHDEPMIKALGFFRNAGQHTESLVSS